MYPRFTIKEVLSSTGRMELLGQLSSTQCKEQEWVDENWLGYLQHQERFFYGRWHKEADLWRFTFEHEYEGELEFQTGQELIVFDGYWGERVEIVLNVNMSWREASYRAKEDWDHDHCAICWATISEEENREYRLGNGKVAACHDCFENYIKKRNIGFITCA